ncbi:hypothetical protein BJV74DRAFT_817437 [Russula compacta]|nr:hypothetical protein BJV74DRAFT_817437 [Russula compacta]
MPRSKKVKQPPSPGEEDIDTIAAMSSMDPDFLTLFTNQMKVSLEKKNKVKNAKIMRAARDQLEKLLSTRSQLLEQARSDIASCAQDYLTSYAQDLDEIRTLWISMLQRREALSGLLASEEKMVHKLELDREKNSVVHLAQAKADCEEQGRIIASLG